MPNLPDPDRTNQIIRAMLKHCLEELGLVVDGKRIRRTAELFAEKANRLGRYDPPIQPKEAVAVYLHIAQEILGDPVPECEALRAAADKRDTTSLKEAYLPETKLPLGAGPTAKQ